MQLNVHGWNPNKNSVSNAILAEDIDIALINDHGVKAGEPIKIWNYNVYKTNRLNEYNNGSAIAIKSALQYRIHEDYYSDLLSITIDTNLGPIEIATAYVPPRTGHINYIDFYNLLKKPLPVYIIADLNAKSTTFGDSNTNKTGKQLEMLINRNHCSRIGPDFPTFITNRSSTTPDIILQNNRNLHNTYAKPGPPTTSDHTPIVFIISCNPILIPITKRYSYKQADWTLFKEGLGRFGRIGSLRTKEEIDRQTNRWTESVRLATEKAVPKTSYRPIPYAKDSNKLKELKNRFQRNYLATVVLGPNRERQKERISLRRQLREEIERLRTESWNGLVERTDLERNSKDFWLSVRRMMGKNETGNMRYLKDHDGELVRSDERKEEIFRHYWGKILKISDEDNREFDEETDDTVNRTCLLYTSPSPRDKRQSRMPSSA